MFAFTEAISSLLNSLLATIASLFSKFIKFSFCEISLSVNKTSLLKGLASLPGPLRLCFFLKLSLSSFSVFSSSLCFAAILLKSVFFTPNPPIKENTAILTATLDPTSPKSPYSSSMLVRKALLPVTSLYTASVNKAASDPNAPPGPAKTTFSKKGLNTAKSP